MRWIRYATPNTEHLNVVTVRRGPSQMPLSRIERRRLVSRIGTAGADARSEVRSRFFRFPSLLFWLFFPDFSNSHVKHHPFGSPVTCVKRKILGNVLGVAVICHALFGSSEITVLPSGWGNWTKSGGLGYAGPFMGKGSVEFDQGKYVNWTAQMGGLLLVKKCVWKLQRERACMI